MFWIIFIVAILAIGCLSRPSEKDDSYDFTIEEMILMDELDGED